MNSLVTCGWLHNIIRGATGKTRVLEASWAPKGAGHESFVEQHIPTAHFFDLWRGCTPTQERPRALHNPETFEEYAQQLGINDDSHIVIYDKGQIFFAARLWFQFKAYGHENVSVVDGGMVKWLQENLPVESGDVSAPEAGSFRVNTDNVSKYFKTFEEVSQKNYSQSCQVVDVRQTEHFHGSLPEPSPATVAAIISAGFDSIPKNPVRGHIPGSRNLHYAKLVDPSNRLLLPKDQILSMLKTVGVDPLKPMTSMCYNGVSASILPLALSQIGNNDVSMYTGSWTEYSQRATQDMAKMSDASSGDNPATGG